MSPRQSKSLGLMVLPASEERIELGIMEYLIGICVLAAIVYVAFLKKEPPTLRETLEQELKRREDEIIEIDIGSPRDRYDRAVQFWNSGLGVQQEKATKIYQRLIDENVDFAPPYITYGYMLIMSDPTKNSGKGLGYLKRAVEIEPENQDYRDKLQSMLFMHGKVCWDLEKNDEACRTYLSALNFYTDRGSEFSQDSPLVVRMAFVASRMFSKTALDDDEGAELGVLFFDWCEKAGIDVNEEIDVSDAKAR
jgi:tetratricopeptide (TPR) repeat protein